MQHSRHILSYAEYGLTRHTAPYIVDLARQASRLVLVGTEHSSEPAHPMFDQIEAAFLELSPTFALHEGTAPQIEPEREIAIRRHGEAGLLRHLAARAGIDSASLDIPLPEEARLLRRKLGAGVALVFLVVRQLASYNRKTLRMSYDAYFAEFFALIAPGLQIRTISWPLVEAAHRRLLGRPLAPQQITALDADPMHDDLPTQRIARLSNHLRDRHMLRCLLAALRTNERVFATLGVTHAVMLEPALRAATQIEQ